MAGRSGDGLEKRRSLINQWMDGNAFVASVMAWEFMNEKHNFKTDFLPRGRM
jgi:hypothetical protein